MATITNAAAPAAPPTQLAPDLDPDLQPLYFNPNATIEQRLMLVELQVLRILRELQAAGRAAALDVSLAPEAKPTGKKTKPPAA
jgi:hypothetical protein